MTLGVPLTQGSFLSTAILYVWIESFSLVFVDIYGFNLGENGLAYLGLFVGAIIAYAGFCIYNAKVQIPQIRQYEGKLPPEKRLPIAMFGAFWLRESAPTLPFFPRLFKVSGTSRTDMLCKLKRSACSPSERHLCLACRGSCPSSAPPSSPSEPSSSSSLSSTISRMRTQRRQLRC